MTAGFRLIQRAPTCLGQKIAILRIANAINVLRHEPMNQRRSLCKFFTKTWRFALPVNNGAVERVSGRLSSAANGVVATLRGGRFDQRMPLVNLWARRALRGRLMTHSTHARVGALSVNRQCLW